MKALIICLLFVFVSLSSFGSGTASQRGNHTVYFHNKSDSYLQLHFHSTTRGRAPIVKPPVGPGEQITWYDIPVDGYYVTPHTSAAASGRRYYRSPVDCYSRIKKDLETYIITFSRRGGDCTVSS